MGVVETVLFFLMIVSVTYTLYAVYRTRKFFNTASGPERKDEDQKFPPVTLIKPVAETDKNSFEQFERFCEQDYPEYEILFAVSGCSRGFLSVVEDLRKRFPHRKLGLVEVGYNPGPNYKIGNLMGAEQKARYEILVISDSDIRVGPNYLRKVVPPLLAEEVGLVTCLYRNVRIRSIYGALEALNIQMDFIPRVLLDHRLEGISYSFGATLCTTREIISGLGGLEVFLPYLADDYQIGSRIHQKGFEIHLSPHLLGHISSPASFREFFQRQLRAAVTQKTCRPSGYFLSIITHTTFLALCFMVMRGFDLYGSAAFMSVCALRIYGGISMNRTVIKNSELGNYFWLVPLNDLMNTFIWFISLFVKTIYWGNRRYRVRRGGEMVEVEERKA